MCQGYPQGGRICGRVIKNLVQDGRVAAKAGPGAAFAAFRPQKACEIFTAIGILRYDHQVIQCNPPCIGIKTR